MAEIFAEVDLTTVVATIVGLLAVAIGTHLAFKGQNLGSRAIKRV